ncbi:RNA-directed DNA polymerase [Candidatus Magnetobacterium bavaricum]|uniref:RNA-directed DNA polymerase n=1 Tax=Candidatus Magnetobacterium bavaricum TaxID=29290 RepID=A0A0F3GP21_9BACT|nr:RNA-directed DNA polymerase [Candidatus Magnetobacterium bavaricum]
MLTDRTKKALKGINNCSTNENAKVKHLFQMATNYTDLWMEAYQNIRANAGALTKGVCNITMDGFSEERAKNIMKLLKEERYHFKPVRRIYIPKANGKMRPLGIPSGDDKLVQEVWRMLLEQIYEPVFSNDSHGFRPVRSCHTALKRVSQWQGTKWFIEFDIKGFFDNINHDKLIDILEKKIEDKKVIKTIKSMLKAGYMEDWKYNKTFSGTPQGGIISPILANIYLNELDEFVGTIDFNKGERRKVNPEHISLTKKIYGLRKRIEIAKTENDTTTVNILIEELKGLQKQQHSIPSKDNYDSNFKRLNYCRYADDFVIGLIGSKAEAEEIKTKITEYLKNQLSLEISPEKTKIIHAEEGIRFLGYDVKSNQGDTDKVLKVKVEGAHTSKRTITGTLRLLVPEGKVQKFCAKYGDIARTHSEHRTELLSSSDIEILLVYNAERRGIANYYVMAKDVKTKLSQMFYLSEYSLYKTLASKHKKSMAKVAGEINKGDYKGIKSKNKKGEEKIYKLFTLKDLKPSVKNLYANPDLQPNVQMYLVRTELEARMNANRCEYCATEDGYFEVHHIHALKDIKDGKEQWQKLMSARKRKTLVLCWSCHHKLHAGKLSDDRRFNKERMESRVH